LKGRSFDLQCRLMPACGRDVGAKRRFGGAHRETPLIRENEDFTGFAAANRGSRETRGGPATTARSRFHLPCRHHNPRALDGLQYKSKRAILVRHVRDFEVGFIDIAEIGPCRNAYLL
jgi:hypothetical protein